MSTAAELKDIFRAGWSNQERVDNWVNLAPLGEFHHTACRRAWADALEATLGAVEPGRALDAGTGPGTIAGLWAELGWRATGLDFSPAMLAAGRAIARKRKLEIEFVEGDVEAPPFGSGTFDLVSSRLVLFTLPQPGVAIRRWVEILKPGGLLVLIGETPPVDPIKRQRRDGMRPGWQADDNYRAALGQLPFKGHTAGTLQVVMEAAGLEDIHTVDTEAIVAAREIFNGDAPTHREHLSTPYIIVGRKP